MQSLENEDLLKDSVQVLKETTLVYHKHVAGQELTPALMTIDGVTS